MRLKAKRVKGGFMIPMIKGFENKEEIEVEIRNELGIEKTFTEKLWETVGEFPQKKINWKKRWNKHLEDKYGY
ncbi:MULTISPECIES: hypothetical protein [Thermodesulfovibrio]|jgi:hypothetical protein|uniref:hypothetical protein n=1 Tax=Thermodesulfovibrio TaxID=28261 RepID=UPI002603ECD4|nr:hypothetical protein [Thermodesulfovibrio sp.]